MLYILKILIKFGVAPRSFFENQNCVQDRDQDQDHDFTLDFNTRPTFHTSKTPTKFCFDPLTPSKFIVSTARMYSTYRQTIGQKQTDRQRDRHFFCLFCLLRDTKHEHSSKGENFFFHSCDYNTYSLCDEKVKIKLQTTTNGFKVQARR